MKVVISLILLVAGFQCLSFKMYNQKNYGLGFIMRPSVSKVGSINPPSSPTVMSQHVCEPPSITEMLLGGKGMYHPEVGASTASDDDSVLLNSDNKVITIPNSCFSIIFVKKTAMVIDEVDEVDLSLPEEIDTRFYAKGIWAPIEVKIIKNETELTYYTIRLKAFLTNQVWQKHIDGFLGISPCPASLADYSFASQVKKYLGNNDIYNIQWIRTKSLDHDEEYEEVGELRINEFDKNDNDNPLSRSDFSLVKVWK